MLKSLTTDKYLDYNQAYLRLENEYYKYGSLVVAFDFDNTVYDFHKEGDTFNDIIDLLQKLKDLNCYLICFTANEDTEFISKYLNDNKIPFDAINENPPFFPCNSRKIYYNVLLDDRAGLLETYKHLTALCNKVYAQKDYESIIASR